MRQILFKAKRVDTGEWIEGDLQTNEIGDTWISKLTSQINGDGGYFHNVDFKTICQYIGLKDKEGVKIFEGDKVMHPTLIDVYLVTVGSSCNFVMRAIKPDKLGMLERSIFKHRADKLKVIGNIHD